MVMRPSLHLGVGKHRRYHFDVLIFVEDVEVVKLLLGCGLHVRVLGEDVVEERRPIFYRQVYPNVDKSSPVSSVVAALLSAYRTPVSSPASAKRRRSCFSRSWDGSLASVL